MFTHTLPIIFGYSQLMEPLDLLIVLVCLFGILYLSAPISENLPPMPETAGLSFYQYLYWAWFGKLDAHAIFWPFFLILNGALYGADYAVKAGMLSVSSWGNIHVMLAGPIIWWTVATWRGSEQFHSRAWSACTRLATLSAYGEYGLKLYIFKHYPRLFFNCEELLMDYFNCF